MFNFPPKYTFHVLTCSLFVLNLNQPTSDVSAPNMSSTTIIFFVRRKKMETHHVEHSCKKRKPKNLVFGEKVQIIFNKKDVKDKRSLPKNVKVLGETSEIFCKILKILERSFVRL